MVFDHAIHIVFIELLPVSLDSFAWSVLASSGGSSLKLRFLDCASSCSSFSAVVWSCTIIWANCFTLGFLLLAATIFPSSISALLPWAALVTKSWSELVEGLEAAAPEFG